MFSDSIEAINILLRDRGDNHPYRNLIEETRCTSYADWSVEVRHAHREILLSADKLAREAHSDDPHVLFFPDVQECCFSEFWTDMFRGPLDHKPEENIIGNALFRWQSDVHDPHTFVDLYVSNSDQILQMRSCAYYPRYGFGAYGIFPLLLKKRESSEDFGQMGLRYGSKNLSCGVSLMPFASMLPDFLC
ncbi:hypothetical protein K1719_017691 [Acacia pycnantha]|nr:hypothetical protein K1719_017691 [Acacia pycnantha]